ncbi:hypothetical protein EVAR_44625_1 [Eumeta japonica]|uniref:Uncharacterized protein n=1 Tax=Eumeta variegata TaxID=151549 RepID=A0A4C1YZL0_EUMVA|nr:hypothetical protein EVAR_44625_1 [Eumeta japonica]
MYNDDMYDDIRCISKAELIQRLVGTGNPFRHRFRQSAEQEIQKVLSTTAIKLHLRFEEHYFMKKKTLITREAAIFLFFPQPAGLRAGEKDAMLCQAPGRSPNKAIKLSCWAARVYRLRYEGFPGIALIDSVDTLYCFFNKQAVGYLATFPITLLP